MFADIIYRRVVELNDLGNRRLIVFGDSFAEIRKNKSGDGSYIEWSWQILLANYLNCSEIIGYGRGGSSLFFTLQSLQHYIKTEHDVKDIIVLLMTSHNRLPVVDKNIDNGWQSSLISMLLNTIPKNDERYKYFNSNKDTFIWMHENLCTLENNFMLCDYIIARLNMLGNKFLTLSCFENEVNYFNDPICLYNISQSEITTTFSEKDKLMYLHNDSRVNHLSPVNHAVLALQIFEFLKNKNKECFDLAAYKKNIITNIQ